MTDTTALVTAEEPANETPFRWRLRHRPDLRFGHAAGGVAGILAAAAIVAFVIEVTDDDATLPGVGFNLVLIAAALAVGYLVRGPVRSAAVAAILFAIPQVWLFAIIGDGEGVDRGDFRIVLLLSVATYVLFYTLTWTRGRAVLLGLALLLFTNWIVFEVADQSTPFGVGAAARVQRGFEGPQQLVGDDDNLTATGITELIMGAVLLGGAVVLDRRGRVGAATPLLVVGGLQAVNAAATLGIDAEDVYVVGIFLTLAGLVIGLAGSLGRRRGTSYVGAAIMLIGALVVVGKGTSDSASGDGSAAVFGAFALVAAAALLIVGVLVARATNEPIDGGEPAIVKPPTPEPEPALVGAPAEEAAAEAPAGDVPAAETPPADTPPAQAPPPEAPPDDTPPADTPPAEASPDDTGWSGPPPES
jgi:hypothetical protein